MTTKSKQAVDRKGRLRWFVVYLAPLRRRVVWAATKVEATTKATLEWSAPDRIEPAPADYRNKSRGGTRNRKLALRLSEEQLVELHRRYGEPIGSFTRNLLDRLLPPA